MLGCIFEIRIDINGLDDSRHTPGVGPSMSSKDLHGGRQRKVHPIVLQSPTEVSLKENLKHYARRHISLNDHAAKVQDLRLTLFSCTGYYIYCEKSIPNVKAPCERFSIGNVEHNHEHFSFCD